MPCSYCGKDQIVASGLCRACYTRKHRTGSLEYKKLGKPKRLCSVEGCINEHKAKGLCAQHYISMERHGNIISPFGYGERQKHELYNAWCHQQKSILGRVEAWNDFWSFVDDVGVKPKFKCRLIKIDKSKAWGPENFQWEKLGHGYEDRNLRMREYRKDNPARFKEIALKKKFGIGLDDYMKMYISQNGKCAICGKDGAMASEKFDVARTLVVDHCHNSHKIRKLLCSKCNRGLGCFSDDSETLKKAALYLKSHQNSVV